MAQIIVTTLDDEYDSGATVANPGGQGLSLREAIARANALAGADEIIFAPGLSGTITLVNGFSFISSEISINGDVDGDLDADITIDANDAQAHFLVGGSGTLALNGFRLTNGNYYLGSGSIDNSGDLVVTNTTFDGNDGSQGGALFNRTGATANLTNVTFSDNSANVGGAIYNFGDLTVVNGTFAGNYAQNYGGAINNGPSGDVSLVNATLTDNEAQIDGGGIKDFAFDAVTLRNSIVLGNRSTGVVEISGDASLQAANIVGSQLSQDGVVLNVFDPSDVFRSAAGDVGELADNGGSVQTVRINAIGPAADAGSGNPPLDELDADRDGSTTDLLAGANGPARAANAFDLGAYEAVAATRIEVTNVNDSGAGSLRQAIADAGTASNVFITFADDLAGQTIALQSTLTIQSGAEITITGDVDGDGDKDVVISGDRTGNGPSLSDVRIMNVEAGAYVRLDDITLADGFDRGSNSFSNTSTGAFAVAGDGASTILSSGDVTLSNVLIANAYSSGGDGRDYPINGTRDGGDAAAIIVEGGAFRATDLFVEDVVANGGFGAAFQYFPGDSGSAAPIIIRAGAVATIERAAFTGEATGADGPDDYGYPGDGGSAAATFINEGTTTATRVAPVAGAFTATGGMGGLTDNTELYENGRDGAVGVYLNLGGTTSFSSASTYGNGDDVIQGAGGEDAPKFIVAADGADTITIGVIGDTVFAGDGADKISFVNGPASIYGQGGDDLIVSSIPLGTHRIDGGRGSDTLDLSALLGDDLNIDLNRSDLQTVSSFFNLAISEVENLVGSIGNDMLTARRGGEPALLDGGGGRDTLIGQSGDDTLIAGDGGSTFNRQELSGGDGDDLFVIRGSGSINVDGGGGDANAIDFSDQAQAVFLELAFSGLRNLAPGLSAAVSNISNIIGSDHGDGLAGTNGSSNDDGRNLLKGGGGGDFLDGLAGEDTLMGEAGDDTLRGGADNDILDGGADSDTADFSDARSETLAILLNREGIAQSTLSSGRDVLIGIENLIGSGHNDRLFGDANANRIEGGDGGDTIDGVAGDDSLFGGAGNDGFRARGGPDFFDGGFDTDFVNYADSTGVNAFLNAANGTNGRAAVGDTFVDIENLIGSSTGSDRLFGDGEANRLTGLGGDDTLRGFEGIDQLEGGEGADSLIGDGGADVIVTGIGADTIVFNTAPNAVERDRITDFESGVDTLQIDASVFGGGLVAGQSAVLVANGNPTAATGNATFLYDTDNGTLRFDADGTGAGAAVLFAFLQNVPTIDAGDFEFV